MDQLKTYFNGLLPDEREVFAGLCNTTARHIKNVMYEVRPCAPALAVLIEKHSNGAVPRPTLRKDWKEIWPELSGASDGRTQQHGSPPRPAQAAPTPQEASHG